MLLNDISEEVKTVIKKYPFVRQQDRTDCGIACLSMLIQYYHGYLALPRLRDMCDTNRRGTTAYHLIQAAKEIGFRAYGVKLESIEVRDVIFPFIAHLKIADDCYHYVVVYKMNPHKKTLLIADPATKIERVSMDFFLEQWTNVAIILYPIHSLPILDDQLSFSEFLITVMKPYRMIFGKLFFLSMIFSITSVVSGFFLQFVLEAVSGFTQLRQLQVVCLIFFLIYLFKNVTDYMRNRLFVIFYEKVQLFLNSDIFKRLVFLPYRYYENRSTGEVLAKLEEMTQIQLFLGNLCLFLSFDAILIVVSFLVLWCFHSMLFLLQLFLCLIMMGLFWGLRFRYQKCQLRLQQQKGIINQTMTETLTAFESVKGNHLEHHVISYFLTDYLKMASRRIRKQRLVYCHQFAHQLICDSIYVIQLLIAGYFIIDGTMKVGSIMILQTLMMYVIGGMEQLQTLLQYYYQARISFDRLSFLFMEKQNNNSMVVDCLGSICIQNLTFSYGNGQPLIEKASFQIPAGAKVLLLGHSGSGKSTLLKLLMRYYDIDRGQILIDGVDIMDYTEQGLANHICYLNQLGTLFSGTIYENIVLKRTISSQQFLEIVRLCKIDQILQQRNIGFTMRLEENGANLSGGERQRILLARALLCPFDILLIDEGTSQMDDWLEQHILQALFSKYCQKTIIVISHRQNSAWLFDQIVELKDHHLRRLA